jgi:hypothetical protein
MPKVSEMVVRSQHAKKGKSGYSGPDTYICVVTRDVGGEPVGNHPLTRHNQERFGWAVTYIGEAYSRSSGPRSLMAKYIREAKELVAEIEASNAM